MNIDETVKSQGINENEFSQPVGAPVVEEQKVSGFDFLAWLKSETGPGDVEEYMGHPLNFLKSRGMAQMLRGLTGLIGNLKLAVIDIVVGGFNFAKERRVENVGNTGDAT